MKKELICSVKSYLLLLYYSLFLLIMLVYITSFHSVLAGTAFLVILLSKYYAGSKLTIHLVRYCILSWKAMPGKQQVKTNALLVGLLLLADLCMGIYLPDLAKLNYTLVSFALFVHVASQCILYRQKKNSYRD